MRVSNLGLVLRYLYENGERSRAVLADEVGLSKASITSIVADLAERGLVREGAISREGRVGRPGTKIEIDGSHVCGIGVEINVDYVSATVVDLAGEVRATRTVPMPAPPEPESVVAVVAQVVRDLLDLLRGEGMWPAGVTVAPPGVIDYDRGMVRFAPNIQWHDVALVDLLEAAIGNAELMIEVENDAKLSAVAAFAESDRDDARDLVFVTGDVGVGAGIISAGRLVRGWSGFSGEVGHMCVHEGGASCRCGRRGCWEMYVGLPVLLNSTPQTSVARDIRVPMVERLAAVRELANAGEPRVRAVLAQITTELITGLSLLTDVLNPKVIVLGGYFGELADYFLTPVQEALDARVLDAGGIVHVERAARGLDAAAMGGALLALESVLADPMRVPLFSGT